MTPKLPLLLGLGLLSLLCQDRAQNDVWTVQHLESLEYPTLAVLAREQAVLRIECTVAADGTVLDARIANRSGVSRPGSVLEQSAIENVRKWKFHFTGRTSRAQPGKSALVYDFRLVGTCAASPCPTRFEFDLPGRVTVTAQYRPLDHAMVP